MIPFSKSLGFRLLVISFILLALPLLVDSFILLQERYSHAVTDAEKIIMEAARLRELSLAGLTPTHQSLVDLFVRLLDLENFPTQPSAKLNERLETLAKNGGLYGIVLIKTEPNGGYKSVGSNLQAYQDKDFTDFFKLQNFYNPGALNRGYASYFLLKAESRQPLFLIAHPIYSEKKNENVGIILLIHDIAPKIEKYLHTDERRYQINFALLLPSTVVIASSDPNLRFHYFLPLAPEFKKLFLEQEPQVTSLADKPLPVQNFSNYPFFEFEWDGEQQIGFFKRLPGMDYSILTYTSKNAIFQKPLLEFVDIYSVYGIILTIGGFIAAIATVRMAKPMQNLGLVMQKIQSGNLDWRYKNDPFGFEINTLGEIFNGMVDTVLEKKGIAEEERVKRETFAKELRLGQQIQRSLLPQHMPHYPGVDVAEVYIPTIEVGGDFYDVFVKNQGSKLMLMIADVSGKGVQGCLYSLSVRNMLRLYAKEYDDIADAMHRTNELFLQDTRDSGMFVTALCASFDIKTKLFSYYSCGHNPGIVLRKDGSAEFLENNGMALGVFATEKGKTSTIKLDVGDAVIFYTDGVTEAHDIRYQNFGEERLIESLKAVHVKGATEIAEEIVRRLNAFVASAMQHDDITLLVMKVEGDA